MNGRLTTAMDVTVYNGHKNGMYTDSPLDLQDALQEKEGCIEWAVKNVIKNALHIDGTNRDESVSKLWRILDGFTCPLVVVIISSLFILF